MGLEVQGLGVRVGNLEFKVLGQSAILGATRCASYQRAETISPPVVAGNLPQDLNSRF